MSWFDMPLPQLEQYLPDRSEPADFDQFWNTTLTEQAATTADATFTRIDNGLATLETFDVSFAGYDGSPVRGWLHLPVTRTGPLPVVVEYIGYGNGRGVAHERTLWASAGYAHFVMDTRGQGTATPDPGAAVDDPTVPGFLTRGLLDPRRHYYRRVFVDAVHAVAAARQHPSVDAARVAVTGVSQGGGIALVVAGLVPDLVAVMPDVPFLCDFPRATTLVDSHPYVEVQNYLRRHRGHAPAANRTLSYLDAASHARRAYAPALFSVALMDQVCPPSTVYAAFNSYGQAHTLAAPAKEIKVYPYNGHEGGGAEHEAVKLAWLGRLPASRPDTP